MASKKSKYINLNQTDEELKKIAEWIAQDHSIAPAVLLGPVRMAYEIYPRNKFKFRPQDFPRHAKFFFDEGLRAGIEVNGLCQMMRRQNIQVKKELRVIYDF